ncbi:hypothetical protein [Laceyella putida]|uniref:Glycerophosphoryl diester phosphodiesterase membrane domain-containing protein n=1 Tax=Laceyella putida TaxID=110101 RepID=A0ABW2RPC6_9BACL
MEHIKTHGFKLAWMQLLGMIVFGAIYAGISLAFSLLMVAVGASESLFADPLEDPAQLGSGTLIASIIAYLCMFLAQLVVGAMSTGASYGAGIEAVFQNRSSLDLYFHHAFHHIKRLTFLTLIVSALFIPAVMIAAIIFIVFAESAPDLEAVGLGLFIFILALYALFVYAVTIFAPIMIIKEKSTAWQSVKQSTKLWKRAFGKSFVTVLTAAVTALGIILGYGLILLILAVIMGVSFESGMSGLGTMSVIFLVIFGIFFFIFVGPFAGVSANLILASRYKDHLRPVLFPEQYQAAGEDQASHASATPVAPTEDEMIQTSEPSDMPQGEETDTPSADDERTPPKM